MKVSFEAAEVDAILFEIYAPTHGIEDGFWLLVNFLLHKVVEVALHDVGKLQLERLNGSDTGDTVILAKAMNVKFWHSQSMSAESKIMSR